ncbi:type II toxin-antitoxin system RelE/ParE family toxin [Pluralibacter gergoviae]|nr:type II toxin-antitoxin system RelE/ParE family toxin [Pluralibacter gergoviae]ELG9931638.1 type II toxin-antitoxin system RelE/ParE family toxin [Pluralibacter gergoviae]ELK5595493.1 type II toxin-antitoxin system RelE/ParE family toxin [Pluralibacter gergoviae]KMK08260.1 ABC transporter ATP-binding protein [Pluralibacter gergoviae]OHY62992.1 ABC transporter ATP-binding protein [Pluralibacter gergoviae]
MLSSNAIGTRRPELGEGIFSLPVERHMLYFLQTAMDIIIIRILSQHQDAGRHLIWR